MVLLLDDLHWADDSSLAFLQHLAPHLRKIPVLILGTYRDVELVRRGEAATALHGSLDERWLLLNTLGVLVHGLLLAGKFEELQRVLEDLEPLAERQGDRRGRYWSLLAGACIQLAHGNLKRCRELWEECTRFSQDSGFLSVMWLGYAGLTSLWMGQDAAASRYFKEAAENDANYPVWDGVPQGQRLLAKGYSQEPVVLAELERLRALLPSPGVPNGTGPWFLLASAVESFAMLGNKEAAAELYPLTLDLLATGTRLIYCLGLAERAAGIAAGAGGRFEKAESHFERALEQAVEMPHRVEQAEARRWHAWMLLERGTDEDRDRARLLLQKALALYEELGMPRHRAIATELLETAGRR